MIRKPLLVLLVVSLMGNAVGLGAWLGRRHFAPTHPSPLFAPPPEARDALSALDDARRQALTDGLAAAREAMVAAKAGQGELHRRAYERLTAESFDEAAWRAAVAELVAARRTRGEAMTDAVAELARRRDRDERMALAALLYDRRHRR